MGAPNSRAMAGKAGMYMSTAKGVKVVSAPKRTISSTRRMPVGRPDKAEEDAGMAARNRPRPSPGQGQDSFRISRLFMDGVGAGLYGRPMADSAPGAFAPFEWKIALRYLRARRKEGFVSFISVISL